MKKVCHMWSRLGSFSLALLVHDSGESGSVTAATSKEGSRRANFSASLCCAALKQSLADTLRSKVGEVVVGGVCGGGGGGTFFQNLMWYCVHQNNTMTLLTLNTNNTTTLASG